MRRVSRPWLYYIQTRAHSICRRFAPCTAQGIRPRTFARPAALCRPCSAASARSAHGGPCGPSHFFFGGFFMRIQLSDHFSYGKAAALHAFHHTHAHLHVHVQHCGRLLRLELCGQNGVRGGEPHLPCVHGRHGHRLHAGHGRQRHCVQNAGPGRPAACQPLLFPHHLCRHRRGRGAQRAVLCLHAADSRLAGRAGRVDAAVRGVRAHSVSGAGRLHAADDVPDFFRGGGKAGPQPEDKPSGRGHQHGVRLSVRGRAALGACGARPPPPP